MNLNSPNQIAQNRYSNINYFSEQEIRNSFYFNESGQFDTGFGSMRDIFIQNNIAFTAVEGAGMIVFDISDLTNPTIIGQFEDEYDISEEFLWSSEASFSDSICVKDNIAYLADSFNGLVVLNVSNPSQPLKIGHYLKSEYSSISKTIIQGNYAFVRDTDNIYILNIEDPTQLILTGIIDWLHFPIMSFHDFSVIENYVYICANDLLTIDISDPANPIEISRLENASGRRIITTRNFAYTLYFYGLRIINISNSTSPFITRTIDLPVTQAPEDISLSNNTIYVAGYSEIITVDVSNNSEPNILGELANLGFSHKKMYKQLDNLPEKYSGLVFCADYNKGLLIINFTNSFDPRIISIFDMGTKTSAVFTDGQYIYLCTRHESPWSPTYLQIISWTGEIAQFIGQYKSNQTITDVFVHNNLAYLSSFYHGIEILNITNPFHPTRIGFFDAPSLGGRKIFFDASQELVVLANEGAGYAIINVSDPTAPHLLSSGNLGFMNIVDVFIEGNYLFLADSQYDGGFAILDISNSTTPQFVSAVGLGERVFSIFASEGKVYLSTDFTPLYTYDITTISNPKRLSRFYTGWWFPGHGLNVQNSVAYIARDVNGLMAIDVSNPTKPKLLTTFRDYYAGSSFDVTTQGDYIFLADGWDGLEILKLIPPEIPFRNYLLMTILPPIGGVCLVIVIVIIQYSKNKKTAN